MDDGAVLAIEALVGRMKDAGMKIPDIHELVKLQEGKMKHHPPYPLHQSVRMKVVSSKQGMIDDLVCEEVKHRHIAFERPEVEEFHLRMAKLREFQRKDLEMFKDKPD